MQDIKGKRAPMMVYETQGPLVLFLPFLAFPFPFPECCLQSIRLNYTFNPVKEKNRGEGVVLVLLTRDGQGSFPPQLHICLLIQTDSLFCLIYKDHLLL